MRQLVPADFLVYPWTYGSFTGTRSFHSAFRRVLSQFRRSGPRRRSPQCRLSHRRDGSESGRSESGNEISKSLESKWLRSRPECNTRTICNSSLASGRERSLMKNLIIGGGGTMANIFFSGTHGHTMRSGNGNGVHRRMLQIRGLINDGVPRTSWRSSQHLRGRGFGYNPVISPCWTERQVERDLGATVVQDCYAQHQGGSGEAKDETCCLLTECRLDGPRTQDEVVRRSAKGLHLTEWSKQLATDWIRYDGRRFCSYKKRSDVLRKKVLNEAHSPPTCCCRCSGFGGPPSDPWPSIFAGGRSR